MPVMPWVFAVHAVVQIGRRRYSRGMGGLRAGSAKSSGVAWPGTRYSPLAQAPRSIRRQRSEQKGR